MLPVDLIVAMDDRNGIGKAGDLPWHLPPDLKHFREITTKTLSDDSQNVVVMGRKTWVSIPDKFRPLPNRINAVLSRNADFSLPNDVLLISCMSDINSGLSQFSKNCETIFIIGGSQVYQAALEELTCRRIYVTRIRGDFICDAFFPTIPERFRLIHEGLECQHEAISYTFQTYQSNA